MKKSIGKSIQLSNKGKTKQQEQADQNQFLLQMINSLPHPFYVIDVETYKVILANSATLQIAKHPAATTCYALTHNRKLPCGSQEHLCPLEEIKKTKKPVVVEHIHYDKDGKAMTVEFHGVPVFDENGKLKQVIEYAIDISKHRKAEDNLRESETKFRTLAEHVPGVIYLCRNDKQPTMLYLNDKVKSLTGYTKEDFLSERISFWKLYHPEDAAGILSVVNKALKRGKAFHPVYRIRHKNGSWRWVQEHGIGVSNEKGEVLFLEGFITDITKRKQAEDAVEQSENKFHDFFRNAPIGFHIFGPDRKIIDINDAELEMIGYKRKEIVGKKTWSDLIVPQQRQQFEKHWKDITTKGEVRNLEYTLVHKNGSHVDVILNASSNFDKKDRLVNTRGSTLNVTEQKKAEQALRESERRLSSVMGNMPGMAYRSLNQKDLPMLFVSDGCMKLTGYKADDLCNPEIMTFSDLILPEYHDYVWDHVQQALEQRRPYVLEYRIITALGQVKWVWEKGIGVYSDENELLALEGFVTDITRRKKIEDTLAKERNILRILIDNIPDYIYVKDLDSKFLAGNIALTKHFGLQNLDELIGKTDFDFLPKNIAKEFRDDELKIYKTGEPLVNKEEFGTDQFGNPVSLLATKSPLRDSYGNIIGLVGVSRDITERELVKQTLQKSEKKYRELVETMNEGLCVTDIDSKITYVNQSFTKMLGYDTKEMVGKKIFDFIDNENKIRLTKHLEKRRKGETKEYDLSFTRNDGTQIDTIVSPRILLDDNGKPAGSFGVITNITERKKAEIARELLTRELEVKNKELESILYVASHDLRTPLVNITGFSHELNRCCDMISSALEKNLAQADVSEDVQVAFYDTIPKAMNYISTSAKKMDSLLNGLLRLSRLGKTAMKVEPLGMNKMMRNITANLKYQIKAKNIKVSVRQLPDCYGDASQINQVFTNIIDNAIKYLDETRPGKINISGKVDNKMSIYCIKDNGIGISPGHQNKIFEIFHRLEPEKKEGEGLGLTIVKRIIDRHDGRIWVESLPKKGSKFYVALPSKLKPSSIRAF